MRTRRAVIAQFASSLVTAMVTNNSLSFADIPQEASNWMDQVFLLQKNRGQIGEPPVFSRFRDPIYFLLRPISWTPSSDEAKKLNAVVAPTGFVTDLASIPRVFWSLLRPDGEYAYAAILHDYMYWKQDRTRALADETFFLVMKDYGVDPTAASTIYTAVRAGGQGAWDGNTKLKAAGERRTLKQYPSDATITWEKWKAVPNVFTAD